MASCPVWHGAIKIHALFGLKRTHLNKLADDGHIRRRKIGASAQADVLYHVPDVLKFMASDKPYAVECRTTRKCD